MGNRVQALIGPVGVHAPGAMIDAVINQAISDYPLLARHIGGVSYRALGEELRCSHEKARQVVIQESADLVDEIEALLHEGTKPVFIVHFRWAEDRWRLAMASFSYVVDELKARGIPVRVTSAPAKDAVCFVLEEEGS